MPSNAERNRKRRARRREACELQKQELRRLQKVVKAIAEGYEVLVSDDRYIKVVNPEYQPDDGSNPFLVIDVFAFAQRVENAK